MKKRAIELTKREKIRMQNPEYEIEYNSEKSPLLRLDYVLKELQSVGGDVEITNPQSKNYADMKSDLGILLKRLHTVFDVPVS